jgi:hypothetical protein
MRQVGRWMAWGMILAGCETGGGQASTQVDAVASQDVQTAGTDAQAQDMGQGQQDAALAQDSQPTEDVAPQVDVPVAQDTAPPAQVSYPLHMGEWTMKPKQETTRCVVKRLGNTTDIWVDAIHAKLAKGSHHVIVYRSDATEEKLTPFACDPFTETLAGGNVPLMITQVPEETLQLPPGIAFQFKAGQMVRVEAHFLNYFPNDIQATADVDFHTLPTEKVKDAADLLFYGTADFYLPAGKKSQTPWHYLPMWEGTHIFAMTGHTHALGTNVEVALADGGTMTDPPMLYPGTAEYVWSEPPIAKFEPPLTIGKNQGFQYRCTWDNNTGKGVGFGESATKEMCFFWGYYYPAKGYRMCVNPGVQAQQYAKQYGFDVGDSVCCPDDDLCDVLKLYLGNVSGK